MSYSDLTMKTDQEFATFAKRKIEFVTKWGDDLFMAAGSQRVVMLKEAERLAKQARLPVEQFVSRLAKLRVEAL
jgi:heptaprenylglyceryl phosphate synthase